jgi:uncharacterized membrane protein YfcA
VADPLVVAIGALLGLALGLLGGGGGVLAVPLLVALGEPVIVASTMSLVIVGIGSAAALVPHQRAGRVDWPVGLSFGVLGSAGAVLGARVAPELNPAFLLAGLAVLLTLGAATMLRAARRARRQAPAAAPPPLVPAGAAADQSAASTVPPAATEDHGKPHRSRARIVALSTGVGLITGVFGVGAGFVVVPALVSAMRVPIKRATATALVVIALNASMALAVRHDDLGSAELTAALAASTGVFAVVGALTSRRVPGWVLSAAFGALMLMAAAWTVTRAVLAA